MATRRPAPRAKAARAGGGGSTQRDAAVWGAVALQRHLAMEMRMDGNVRRAGARTMAEKIGLVEEKKPPPRLTDAQWDGIKQQSDTRGDGEEPCAVCHEGYTIDSTQVILSCSHVFHEACIKSLEKYARSSREQTAAACPMCRRSDYQKTKHDSWALAHRNKTATKIQAVWRGFSSRRLVLRYRLATDKHFREEIYFKICQKISNEEMRAAEARARDLDKLFADMERERIASQLQALTQDDWDRARAKLLERGLHECSICMNPLACTSGAGCGVGDDDAPHAREAVLLSCSHAFHAPCLLSFEEFERCGSVADTKCPICRSPYLSIPFYD